MEHIIKYKNWAKIISNLVDKKLDKNNEPSRYLTERKIRKNFAKIKTECFKKDKNSIINYYVY